MSKSDETQVHAMPPQTEEYLPAAIQRAVVQTGLKHPITVYPVALGISSAVVGMLFNMPALLGGAVALGLAGPIWAIAQIFFRHDQLGSQYLKSLHQKQKRYEHYLIQKIGLELKGCAETEQLEDHCATGIAQLESIQVKLANVQELLEMKLRPNEITYGRFLGAAEQVSLSVLDNLNAAASLLKSAGSIDPAYIQSRLKDIAGKPVPGKEDEAQRKSLQERLALWNDQLQQVDQLMAGNEKAMTELERISAAVAQWQSDRKFADQDFESAIKQLHALADQAHEYDQLQ
ncbi:MAG: hypothetical protein P8X96_12000 [Desulfobacteraceae bacterium]